MSHSMFTGIRCDVCGQSRLRGADCLNCGDAPFILIRKYGAERAREVWWGKSHPFGVSSQSSQPRLLRRGDEGKNECIYILRGAVS